MLVMHGRRSSCKIRVPTKIEIRAFIRFDNIDITAWRKANIILNETNSFSY